MDEIDEHFADHFMADDAPPWPPEGVVMAPARLWPTMLRLYGWTETLNYVRHRAGVSGHLAKYHAAWPDQDGRWPQCACHPAPNPAARDYRRRTKHRNRRRK